MEPKQANPAHTASRELLAGHALGILTPEEQAALDAHLAYYPDLQAELTVLNQAVNAIPLALEDRAPSPALRQRLEAAVVADLAAAQPAAPSWPAPIPLDAAPAAPTRPAAAPPAPPPPTSIRSRSFPVNAWAIAAAVLLVITAGAVAWGVQQTRLAGQPERTIALAMTAAAPGASGEVSYLPDSEVLVLTLADLPPLGPDQVYEVWLIGDDGVPAPAGVFTGASARHAVAARPDDYQSVALSIEPGPLGSAAPTADPFAVATLNPQ